jgi:hypothetical protein
MKIRITGLLAEAGHAVNALTETAAFDVTDVSGPYPNRGASRLVRVYADVRMTEEKDTPR